MAHVLTHYNTTACCLPCSPTEVKARMASQQFNLQQLSNLLWSLAILECCDTELWTSCIDQVGQGRCTALRRALKGVLVVAAFNSHAVCSG